MDQEKIFGGGGGGGSEGYLSLLGGGGLPDIFLEFYYENLRNFILPGKDYG